MRHCPSVDRTAIHSQIDNVDRVVKHEKYKKVLYTLIPRNENEISSSFEDIITLKNEGHSQPTNLNKYITKYITMGTKSQILPKFLYRSTLVTKFTNSRKLYGLLCDQSNVP